MYSCTTEIKSIMGKEYLETILFKDSVIIKHTLELVSDINVTQQRSVWEFIKILAERKLQKLNQL